jgi:predicted secreted protein
MTQLAATGTSGASYNISVGVTEKDGTTRSLTAGDLGYRRSGVKSYHIKQIILAPDGVSLVFIVQKEEQDNSGNNIRYMVETARPK